MANRSRLPLCFPLLLALSACNGLFSGQQAADESAQQIANRAAAISAAADANVNQQIADLDAAANDAESQTGNSVTP